jgi:uroporphyrinogen decarboxylase
MTKREVIKSVLAGERPPYVPWSFGFTAEACDKLKAHFGADYETKLGNHLLSLGNGIGWFTEIAPNVLRDVFGVEWDRSVDKDIGVVCNHVLPKATLDGYTFPDPLDPRCFADIPQAMAEYGDRYRVFSIGFSLYERAWTLRGMENLMMDFYDSPEFVHELLTAIADYDLAQVAEALKYDIDAVYFGDDWGQQKGLIMGSRTWHEFIYPQLKRMYGAVRDAGKAVFIHSCGDVDELFDDLIGIGLNCFNPFQPEVMDVFDLLERYRGRLSFHGGLSTQKTLPFGTADDVRDATRRLLAAGAAGGYILSPSHAVEGDVPIENILAFVEETQRQGPA